MVTTRESLPVGVLFSTSGPYAALGREGLAGALAAVAEINSDGAFPFELSAVVRNPEGNTEAYASLCRDIIEASRARFVVGCTTSWSRKEVIPVLEKTGAQLWYPCPYEGFEGNDHVVYVGACPNQHAVPLLDYILPRYGRDPVLVGSNYIWGWETNRIAREYVERAGGTVKGERFVPLGDTDIAHIIAEIRHKRPDFVLNTLIGPSSHTFVEAYYALAQNDPSFAAEHRPIISCNWTENEISALGSKAAGHFTIAPYFQSLASAENTAFLSQMAQYSTGIEHISAFFAQSYTAMHMIARGIAATSELRAESVLAHARSHSFQSPFGPVRIHAATNHSILTPHIGRALAGGGFEVVSTAETAIVPDPYLVRADQRADHATGSATIVPHLRVVK